MTTLIVLGHRIDADGDVLNITAMWHAAGSPKERRPSDWRKDAGNRAFLDHIAMVLNAPAEGIWRGRKGRGGGTWVHWQIGLAYAKWLSPEFHAAANQIIRGYIEGLAVAAAPKITAPQLNAFARAATVILRTLGQRAAVQPISDLARQLGLRVDASQAEIFRQGQLDLPDPKGAP